MRESTHNHTYYFLFFFLINIFNLFIVRSPENKVNSRIITKQS